MSFGCLQYSFTARAPLFSLYISVSNWAFETCETQVGLFWLSLLTCVEEELFNKCSSKKLRHVLVRNMLWIRQRKRVLVCRVFEGKNVETGVIWHHFLPYHLDLGDLRRRTRFLYKIYYRLQRYYVRDIERRMRCRGVWLFSVDYVMKGICFLSNFNKDVYGSIIRKCRCREDVNERWKYESRKLKRRGVCCEHGS